MEHIKITSKAFNLVIILSTFLTILPFCVAKSPKVRVSHYRYEFENKTYRIRSVNFEKKENSYNELISENFVAVDLDQNRIIDQVVMGDANLSEVQKIYEYGLQQLADQRQLKENLPEFSQFMLENECCRYEIKSFRPYDSDPFNEFIFIRYKNTIHQKSMVGLDRNADGKLDVVIKNEIPLEQMQSKYETMIKEGLEKNKLIESNGRILVK